MTGRMDRSRCRGLRVPGRGKANKAVSDQQEAKPFVIEIDGQKFNCPFYDLVPRPSDEEYADLKTSIEDNGILDPVKLITDTDDVIDGHTRLLIAKELGIPLKNIPF